MKVCHLTSVHNRYDVRIFSRECISLQKAGYNVSLIAADGKIDELKNGINIYGVAKGSSRITRMFQTTNNVYKKAIEINADVYHLHDPELIPTGVKLKKKGKKVIFDSHEDVPQQILNKQWIPFFFRKIISIIYSLYERKSLKRFDGLISVNSRIVDRLKKINTNTVMVTNFPIINEYEKNDSKYNKRTICFAGTICENYMIHHILDAISEIDNIKFILAGPCYENYLSELKNKSSWSKVDYKGAISFDKVIEIYNESSIGVAVHDYTYNVGCKEGSLGFIKNFEFMANELPVICTDFVVWKQIIDEEKCGICVAPNDITAIREAITYLLDNPDIARNMGENGRSAVVKKYSWTKQEETLLKFYNQL